ncbi:MAG: HNH endonuclease [Candidatus Sulfotelmatobacter sp.]
MSTCIFCRVESADLTDEHVFPAALGGDLVLKQGSCAGCNHGFSKFEKPLFTELAPFRALFRIPNRRGDVPEVETTIRTDKKDYVGRLKADGSVQPKRTVTEIKNPDGTREFVHRFLTQLQKAKLLKEVSEKGLRYEESGPGDPVRAEIHIGGDLKEIGSLNGLRTVAKIAYVGLAYFAGVRLAIGDSFGQVRNFIMKGSGMPAARQFVNYKFAEEVQQGPHQHSIFLAGRHDQKRVDAIVRLFGGLSYFVVLSNSYAGADFNKTLVYDGYRGAEDGMLFSHIDTEILQLEIVASSPLTVWDDLPASGKFFCDFLERAFRGIALREVKIR